MPGMVVDDVAPSNASFCPFGLVGQRSDARVGKENIVTCQVRLRDDSVRLVYEVIDLFVVGNHEVQVALVADIRRADQVTSIPRYDEERPSVRLRLDIQRLTRG